MASDSMLDELSSLASALGVHADDPETARARASVESKLLGVPLVPPRIGRFVVLERLGAGGMGVVYAAFDPQLDRKVALKLLFERDADRTQRDRLVIEAKAMAKLAHPNVVHVYEVGEHRGQIFVAMEHVRGRTLRAWLAERTRGWRETLAVCVQAGQGLAAAHAAGIVHRDFKPDNVLVGDDARARVLDFGLARTIEERTDPDVGRSLELLDASSAATPGTQTGTVLGTPGYMAPEQMRGERADANSDQFSFCVTVWEALCGALPFPGRNVAALLESVRHGRILPPARGKMPGWVERVLRRGLSTDHRFVTFDELLHALGRDPAKIRARRVAVTAVLAGIATAFAIGSSVRAQDVPCDGGESALDSAWPSVDRDAAFAEIALLGEYGESLAPQLRDDITEYRASWVAGHGDACLAHRRGEQSAELLDRRMTCMHRGRTALATLGGILGDVEASELPRLALAVASLPDPDRCSDLVALADVQPLPTEAVGTSERLAEASMLFAAGRVPAARASVDGVVNEARALAYAPLLAEALLLRGKILLEADDKPQGVEALAEAVTVALTAGADEIAVESWGQQAWAVAIAGEDLGALGGRELIVAIAERRPDSFSTMSLYNNLGGVELAVGDEASARAAYERAIDIGGRLGAPARRSRAGAQVNLAIVLDDPAARERLHVDGIATWTELAGAEHPRTLTARFMQGIATPDRRLALSRLTSVCRDFWTFHPDLRNDLAQCESKLADVAELLGASAASVAATDRWVSVVGEDELELAKGYAALRHGDAATAASILEAVVEHYEADADRHWWNDLLLSKAELGVGRARRALGRADAGDAMVLRGLRRLERVAAQKSSPGTELRLELARAIADGSLPSRRQ